MDTSITSKLITSHQGKSPSLVQSTPISVQNTSLKQDVVENTTKIANTAQLSNEKANAAFQNQLFFQNKNNELKVDIHSTLNDLKSIKNLDNLSRNYIKLVQNHKSTHEAYSNYGVDFAKECGYIMHKNTKNERIPTFEEGLNLILSQNTNCGQVAQAIYLGLANKIYDENHIPSETNKNTFKPSLESFENYLKQQETETPVITILGGMGHSFIILDFGNNQSTIFQANMANYANIYTLEDCFNTGPEIYKTNELKNMLSTIHQCFSNKQSPSLETSTNFIVKLFAIQGGEDRKKIKDILTKKEPSSQFRADCHSFKHHEDLAQQIEVATLRGLQWDKLN